MSRILMKGNEAIAKAAVISGCRYFFGYPITPQNEIPEYMARELPKVGGVFLQSESEVAAINMVYGASGAGGRVMTSSSSPGIALKQEGISYIASAELPCVIVSIMRSGPGLGGIQPSQADYYQTTRGGGNGDYRVISYAPATIQEAVELVQKAFEVSERYRNPAMVVGDGMIGQMMEPVDLSKLEQVKELPREWATTGTANHRGRNIISTLMLDANDLEAHNLKLKAKYNKIETDEALWELYNMEDAEVVIVAYGTTSRIVKNTIEILKREGIVAGLIRPITLWPFPKKSFDFIPKSCRLVMTVEMSMGQMVDDVEIAVRGRYHTGFYGRAGGAVPTPSDIVEAVKSKLEVI
jgi:2-oxoglutarate/2-oxoacid ferredoxin oxidoreductase subunit alpha